MTQDWYKTIVDYVNSNPIFWTNELTSHLGITGEEKYANDERMRAINNVLMKLKRKKIICGSDKKEGHTQYMLLKQIDQSFFLNDRKRKRIFW